MSLKIFYHTDSILRQVSKKIHKNDDVLNVVDKLKDAIRYKDKVWTGTGLSICGIQIGIPLRIILLGRPLFWRHGLHHKGFNVLINPEIVSFDKEIVEDWEGCLSIPDLECLMPRFKSICLQYVNLQGKVVVNNFDLTAARVLQHEIDHLNGVFMTDNAIDSRKKLSEQEMENLDNINRS